jgi:hypothetical protein
MGFPDLTGTPILAAQGEAMMTAHEIFSGPNVQALARTCHASRVANTICCNIGTRNCLRTEKPHPS